MLHVGLCDGFVWGGAIQKYDQLTKYHYHWVRELNSSSGSVSELFTNPIDLVN